VAVARQNDCDAPHLTGLDEELTRFAFAPRYLTISERFATDRRGLYGRAAVSGAGGRRGERRVCGRCAPRSVRSADPDAAMISRPPLTKSKRRPTYGFHHQRVIDRQHDQPLHRPLSVWVSTVAKVKAATGYEAVPSSDSILRDPEIAKAQLLCSAAPTVFPPVFSAHGSGDDAQRPCRGSFVSQCPRDFARRFDQLGLGYLCRVRAGRVRLGPHPQNAADGMR